MAGAQFQAGDVVCLKGDVCRARMTIENVLALLPGRGLGVLCAWFDEHGGAHRDVFHPANLEHALEVE